MLAVGVAANLLLGTISFGTPSIINSGVAPPGHGWETGGAAENLMIMNRLPGSAALAARLGRRLVLTLRDHARQWAPIDSELARDAQIQVNLQAGGQLIPVLKSKDNAEMRHRDHVVANLSCICCLERLADMQ